ncbi:MAG: hypothetical protein SPL94_02130, partial [Oribacterium sp.]|nr:hypothetical protein [Oribacterium sp.]
PTLKSISRGRVQASDWQLMDIANPQIHQPRQSSGFRLAADGYSQPSNPSASAEFKLPIGS